MQQLSERMAEQRLQVADRIRRNMGLGPGAVRILPRDVEAGLKEFAAGVELMVDRLVRSRVRLRVGCPPGPTPLPMCLSMLLHFTAAERLKPARGCPDPLASSRVLERHAG